MEKLSIKRIYHPYWLWEDYKNGFYENISGSEKKLMLEKAVEMFSNEEFSIAWEADGNDILENEEILD